MCDICKMNEATMLVVIEDADDKYRCKSTHRCEECTETAKRSHQHLTITKLK